MGSQHLYFLTQCTHAQRQNVYKRGQQQQHMTVQMERRPGFIANQIKIKVDR